MKTMTYKASQFVHALQDPDEKKNQKSIQITYKLDKAMQNNNNRHIPWQLINVKSPTLKNISNLPSIKEKKLKLRKEKHGDRE